MMLVEPNGWFLLKAEHQHSAIRFRGDEHFPLPHACGAWYVTFQRLPTGGLATSGRGETLAAAWNAATLATLETDIKYPRPWPLRE